MKINTNHAIYSTIGILSGLVLYLGYNNQKTDKKYEDIFDVKNEILQKDPARYDSLIKTKQGCSYEIWNYERRIMNDSLKTDSLVKKAYFEGAQMVRDSIKNKK